MGGSFSGGEASGAPQLIVVTDVSGAKSRTESNRMRCRRRGNRKERRERKCLRAGCHSLSAACVSEELNILTAGEPAKGALNPEQGTPRAECNPDVEATESALLIALRHLVIVLDRPDGRMMMDRVAAGELADGNGEKYLSAQTPGGALYAICAGGRTANEE